MKVIKEQELIIVLRLKRENGVGPVTVEARGDYEVEYEEGRGIRASLNEVVITPAQETAIKSFGANVLSQIKAAEGIS